MPASHPRPVGAATPLVEATAGAASAVLFGAASAIRRARIFHPDGIAFSATLDVGGGDHGAPLLDEPARHRAVIRLSRGIGLPERLPDFLGLALRVLDVHGPGAHQDLLFVTSSSRPGLRHALVPARSYDHERWSTLLPYRVGERRVVFGARPVRSAGPPTTRLADLPEALASARLRFAIDVAEATGPWREVGLLDVGSPLSPPESSALRFNPANTGGGIEPVGVVQAVRRLAYRGSQAARPTS